MNRTLVLLVIIFCFWLFISYTKNIATDNTTEERNTGTGGKSSVTGGAGYSGGGNGGGSRTNTSTNRNTGAGGGSR